MTTLNWIKKLEIPSVFGMPTAEDSRLDDSLIPGDRIPDDSAGQIWLNEKRYTRSMHCDTYSAEERKVVDVYKTLMSNSWYTSRFPGSFNEETDQISNFGKSKQLRNKIRSKSDLTESLSNIIPIKLLSNLKVWIVKNCKDIDFKDSGLLRGDGFYYNLHSRVANFECMELKQQSRVQYTKLMNRYPSVCDYGTQFVGSWVEPLFYDALFLKATEYGVLFDLGLLPCNIAMSVCFKVQE
ncbi:hypothetical protein WN51_11900 [Melipona quadrifasciata]|uniref:Uncharacterized protein n=1 Tax=Melipona quadrifasciata TaxID=166423 RepID=A0A0M9A2V9_9HYME|nr:hypothetical protein WN51_11900 [Melipona quadrifasciata]